jgi:ribosomal protein S24E
MSTDIETPKFEVASPVQSAVKPNNPAALRKAVSLGKDMRKQPDTSKADVARKMYESISDEPREVIVQAFIDGAGLTPKGAQTYFYNCRRRAKKSG